MTATISPPKLITFDGEARSGKGTIVQFTKDYLRDECGYKVMLIDAGQVFRVLVVAATREGVNMENPSAIDEFLNDEAKIEQCVQLVKDVYHMTKPDRDNLLYTNEVGVNSAKIGARAGSQDFKDELLKKWLGDAATEGYEVVLLDGRTLEQAGKMLENEKLCNFIMGFYFTCDSLVGARRTLGFASKSYDDLTEIDKTAVDQLVRQIDTRNAADRERKVQPIIPPSGAETYQLPEVPAHIDFGSRTMVIFDTSNDINKHTMAEPVAKLVATALENR